MRQIRVRKIMITESNKNLIPPWDEEIKTFYIIGVGYLFQARMKDILKAEYDLNIKFQDTKYLTLEHVIFEFGLPIEFIDGKKYVWDYRDEEDSYLTIDFQHEKVLLEVEMDGQKFECICISFRNIPEE